MGRAKDIPQTPHTEKWRDILNEHWPAHPADFKTHYPGIPVTVRIVWEEFGEEFVPGVARRWDAGHVYVERTHVRAERFMTNGVWVKPCDVYRREPDAGLLSGGTNSA